MSTTAPLAPVARPSLKELLALPLGWFLAGAPAAAVLDASGAPAPITLAGDGRTNWLEGAQLVGFYLILAALFYLLPERAA